MRPDLALDESLDAARFEQRDLLGVAQLRVGLVAHLDRERRLPDRTERDAPVIDRDAVQPLARIEQIRAPAVGAADLLHDDWGGLLVAVAEVLAEELCAL